jgi:Zn ribbon nucleic-acid-binding protein
VNCNTCKGDKILSVYAKCSDLCSVSYNGKSLDGYVPTHLGIGGGDYVRFKLCLSCGKVQDTFPKEFEVEEEYSDVPKNCPSCSGQTEWADIESKRVQCFFCGYDGPEA